MATIIISDSFDLTDYPGIIGTHWHKSDRDSIVSECISNTTKFCKIEEGFSDFISSAEQLNIESPLLAETSDKIAATIAIVAIVNDASNIEYWRYH